ncbi:hypothetical protein ACFSBZ_11355 [Amnibacterium flavum]|uniref:Uncharacterized protein n=1 Tax=Amnibacterium flavum TaxID=2173173 RepID=A0A2V1HXM7_9MICO|nr:hypothetical protein [Amnibacterium flavum]PVZ95417.1 hypothetical protein DDQ50_02575 [Amnibacterium flavum]
MTERRRLTRSLTLTGLARQSRGARTGVLAAVSIAGATLALAGCTAPDDGIVLEGADGEKYVVPEDAERPEYNTREDCIADVTEQIRKLEEQGESIVDDPEDLCESTEGYHGAYGHAWVGPLIFAAGRWNSPLVAGWSPVANGGFAAPGSRIQSDVVSPAPSGAKTGDRAPLAGGFGSTGKSGFGESTGG